jgi:hypothetical protein
MVSLFKSTPPLITLPSAKEDFKVRESKNSQNLKEYKMFKNEKPFRQLVYIYPSQYKILSAIAKKRSKRSREVFFECLNLYIKSFLKGRV